MPLKKLLPGLLLTAALALFAVLCAELNSMQRLGFSALTIAILAGMALGNSLYRWVAQPCHDGVSFAKQSLLKLGIVLFGFKLTLLDIASVGWSGIVIDALVLVSTFLLAWWLGHKKLGMDQQSVILIGAGSSICGAAAIMASVSVVNARAEKVSVAVATVVVFGTLAMFLWPTAYAWLRPLGLGISQHSYGGFSGSTIHEVAQAAVAGRSVGVETMNTAVITKMIRVMMLAPFLLALSVWLSRNKTSRTKNTATTAQTPRCITIPWFALWFLAVIAVNSLHLVPESWVDRLIALDNLMLTMAMTALGLTTHWQAIRQAGGRPLLLATGLFLWLIVGGGLINIGVNAL